MNLRPAWGLVNGARGELKTAKLIGSQDDKPSPTGSVSLQSTHSKSAKTHKQFRNAAETGGVSALGVDYLIVDFPGYTGPEQVAGHPTYVVVYVQTGRHEQYGQLSRQQFPIVLAYGITVHKSQGLSLLAHFDALRTAMEGSRDGWRVSGSAHG